MIIRRALSGVKKKIRPRRRAVLVLVLGRVRAAGLGAKALYRFTNAVQLAALQRPTASRNTHQTKAIAIGDGGGIGLGRCDLFGGQFMLTGLQADIGIQLCRDGVGLLQGDLAYGVLVDDVSDLAHTSSENT